MSLRKGMTMLCGIFILMADGRNGYHSGVSLPPLRPAGGGTPRRFMCLLVARTIKSGISILIGLTRMVSAGGTIPSTEMIMPGGVTMYLPILKGGFIPLRWLSVVVAARLIFLLGPQTQRYGICDGHPIGKRGSQFLSIVYFIQRRKFFHISFDLAQEVFALHWLARLAAALVERVNSVHYVNFLLSDTLASRSAC